MPSVNDWAAKAAHQIVGLRNFTPEGLVVQVEHVIRTHAEQLLKLLTEARRYRLKKSKKAKRVTVCKKPMHDKRVTMLKKPTEPKRVT